MNTAPMIAPPAEHRSASSSSTAVAAAAPKTLLELAGIRRTPARLDASVLVVIDVQRDYVGGKLPLPRTTEALQALRRLLERARDAGTPVIHVQQLSPPGRGAFEEGTQGAEFAEEVRPKPGEVVITKRLPNSFAGTRLEQELKRTGRTELIVVGFMTHMCVSTTVRAAIDHGYQVTVVADACATRDLPGPGETVIPARVVQRVALAELADRFACVVRDADAIPAGDPGRADRF